MIPQIKYAYQRSIKPPEEKGTPLANSNNTSFTCAAIFFQYDSVGESFKISDVVSTDMRLPQTRILQ
jgi:hypothetical protein